MNDLSGKTLGPLQVGELIGQGHIATVYKAYEPTQERFVALKVWRAFDKGPTFWDYFPREMQAIARLSHPHLLPIYDFGEQDGLVYIVMEHVPGDTLKHRLEQGSPLPVREAITLLAQACAALGYVHQQGMLHRNLKPQNLLLRSDQDVRLSSAFGIAQLREYRGRLLIKSTQTEPLPQYLSPEQITGSQEDCRSEVYGLGMVLYQAVTGRLPFGEPAQGGFATYAADDRCQVYSRAAAPAAAVCARPAAEACAGDHEGAGERPGPSVSIGAGDERGTGEHQDAAPRCLKELECGLSLKVPMSAGSGPC